MQSEEDQKMIQDYLHKRLTTKEMESFLLRLRNNSDFKQEVLLAQYIHDAFKTSDAVLGSTPVFSKKEAPQSSKSDKSLSTASPQQNIPQASSFEPFPPFERQLSTTRSLATSANQLETLLVVGQENQEDYSEAIDIVLKRVIEVDLEVKVCDNLGNVQKNYSHPSFLPVGETSGQLSLKGLPPACYYIRFKAGRKYKMTIKKIFVGREKVD